MSEKAAAAAESAPVRCSVRASQHPSRLSALIVASGILSEQLAVPDQALCCRHEIAGACASGVSMGSFLHCI